MDFENWAWLFVTAVAWIAGVQLIPLLWKEFQKKESDEEWNKRQW